MTGTAPPFRDIQTEANHEVQFRLKMLKAQGVLDAATLANMKTEVAAEKVNGQVLLLIRMMEKAYCSEEKECVVKCPLTWWDHLKHEKPRWFPMAILKRLSPPRFRETRVRTEALWRPKGQYAEQVRMHFNGPYFNIHSETTEREMGKRHD